jgi:ABC-type transport system involved in multi-copper enzyme maturation permease subunit
MILELTTSQLTGIFIALGFIIVYLIICLVGACISIKKYKESLSNEKINSIHQLDQLNHIIGRQNERLHDVYNEREDKTFIRIKYELNTEVYIYRAGKIYKDRIKEVTYKDGRTFYSTIKVKNVTFDDIFDNFDELCKEKNINKDDILMYAYNNDIDKKERRIEC